MPAYTPSRYADRRSDVIAALASLAMLVLSLTALIDMGWVDLDRGPSGKGSRLVALPLSSDSQSHRNPRQVSQQTKHAPPASQRQPEPTPQPAASPVPTTSFIHLSHADFAAADIAKMPRHREDADDASAQSSASTYGPGEGPGGAHLFNAQWYREPLDAELRPYLSRGAPPNSWAVIACRTVERFHVEDCQELGESPPGSGLARALRQASWQFLVRPPRRNGEPLLGSWVRIRFDFTARGRGDAEADR